MSLKEICLPIQSEVAELESVIKSNLSSDVAFVESVVDYVIQNGGKRLRPILTILSSKLSGFQGKESLQIGASIEFMHTASLLHDDVLDNAQIRRGRPSVNKKWGNHVSVLVGDFFYCRAMDILVKHGDLQILRVVTDAVTHLTEGEILEILKSNDLNTSEDDYLKVVKGKTAALISAACQSGAILGKLSHELQVSLGSFGMNLGMAFQLMDDVLDYTASEKDFGKVTGTDLKEGKLTLPLILTLKRCKEEEGNKIKNAVISDVLNEDEFSKVLSIIETYDGIRDTRRLALSYIEKAKESLHPFRPSIEQETLMALADYVIVREK